MLQNIALYRDFVCVCVGFASIIPLFLGGSCVSECWILESHNCPIYKHFTSQQGEFLMLLHCQEIQE